MLGPLKWASAGRKHDLRHTYASLLIAQGADIVAVSRQLGHASPDITLKVYAHLFDADRNANRTRDLLEESFGTLLDQTETRSVAAESNVVHLPVAVR